MGTTSAVVDFVVEARKEDFPDAYLELARHAILDTIGVTVACMRDEIGQVVSGYVRQAETTAQAGVWGSGVQTSAPLAALANATMARSLEFDDMHTVIAGHPSSILVATVFAVGEAMNRSGREVIEAYLVGFEVLFRLGREMGRAKSLASGTHPIRVSGPVGAAVAASKLYGLDRQRTAMALGIAAGSVTGGLRSDFGTMIKGYHDGEGAMGGVTASLLAAAGYTASDRILEEDGGFFSTFGDDKGFDLDRMVAGLGTEFVSERGWAIKLYPACGKTHASIEAALHLKHEHAIAVEDVAEVEVVVPTETVATVLNKHEPTNAPEAMFSLEYCIAVALTDGRVGLEQFRDARVTEPEIQELLRRVKYVYPKTIRGWDAYTDPETVIVKLRDGTQLSHRAGHTSGQFGRAVTEAEVVAKYRQCAGMVLHPALVDRSLELWSDLDRLDDIGRLAEIVTTSA